MYFITICTKNRKKILSKIEDINENIPVGADASVCPIKLTLIGKTVEKTMKNIEKIYDNIILSKYVIMPNHVHMIIIIKEGGQRRPPLQKIIQGIKSISARNCYQLGYKTIWQRNYYEHVIRNEREYWTIYEYIENNPMKWKYDEYYDNQ